MFIFWIISDFQENLNRMNRYNQKNQCRPGSHRMPCMDWQGAYGPWHFHLGLVVDVSHCSSQICLQWKELFLSVRKYIEYFFHLLNFYWFTLEKNSCFHIPNVLRVTWGNTVSWSGILTACFWLSLMSFWFKLGGLGGFRLRIPCRGGNGGDPANSTDICSGYLLSNV